MGKSIADTRKIWSLLILFTAISGEARLRANDYFADIDTPFMDQHDAFADAHGGCEYCGNTCPSCGLVERTIMVPMMITETRMETCIIKVTEDRQQSYTVFRRVPEERKFSKERCYLEDDVRTKTIENKQCHLVKNPVVATYKVMVPETEQRVEMVRKEICTEHGVECVEEPCVRDVTVLRPDFRSENCERPDVVFSTKKCEISYCVKVPKKQVEVCREETVYKLVPVEKTKVVQVCVPKVVKKPVEVTVCKIVPKTVLCCEACGRNRHGH